jgi:glucose-1-phosphate adenylyltransferase
VACIEVPIEQASELGVMEADVHGHILAFEEKPAHPTPIPGHSGHVLASMGIYIFDTAFLLEELARDAADPHSSHDFGKDIIPHLVRQAGHHVYAHRFQDSCVNMVDGRPYWRDVGTVDAFWEANIDLTHVVPDLNLYDDDWPILSLQRQLPPAKFVFDDPSRRGVAIDSLVSGGCIVSGATVRRSILFSNVRVGEGSVVEDSVLLPNVLVGRSVRLARVVVDKHCRLPDGFCAGIDAQADRERGLHVTPGGITLVSADMLGPGSALQERGS